MPQSGENLPEVSMTTLGLLAAVKSSPGRTAGELFSATVDLFEGQGVNVKQVVQSLKRARQRGWVTTEGTGRRGDPHRFFLTKDGTLATIRLVERFCVFGAQLTAIINKPIFKNVRVDESSDELSKRRSYAQDNPVLVHTMDAAAS